MTPFDRDPPALLRSTQGDLLREYGGRPLPSDPGEPVPAPNDPGDRQGLINRIEKQSAEIHALQAELHEHRRRERMILDIIERERRADAYRRLHERYHEGLGGVGVCDCSAGRGDLIQRAMDKEFDCDTDA
jgi:hypothetical protein